MVAVFDTGAVKAHERVDFWRGMLRDHFGVSAVIDPIGDHEFRQTISIEQLGDVVVGERRGSPFEARRLPESSKKDVVVANFIVDGHCSVDDDRHSSALLRPGSTCVFPLHEPGTMRFADATHHFFLVVPAERLAEHCPEWRTLSEHPLGPDSRPALMLLDLVQSMSRHAEGLGPTCKAAGGNLLVGLLGSALAALDESTPSPSSRMQSFHRERIRNYIRTHLCDPQLSAESIADGLGLSLRYIHRLFADEPLRLMQWVLEQRLTNCHVALSDPQQVAIPIGQIAYRWGFNDAAHFSRAFHKRFGVCPRVLREEFLRKRH